jgi:hypothetical protein
MSAKATNLLQSAIECGRLTLWRVHNGSEVQLTPERLLTNDIKYGVYKPYERPEPDMYGARLWVKADNWIAFLTRLKGPAARNAGRPNQRDEAIALHLERLAAGQACAGKGQEAKAIRALLAEKHNGEEDWSYSIDSIQRAIREHVSSNKNQQKD